ncbi:MAG: L,D-transpeptidase [Bacteroidetes bacterium]|nr:L,D-transpeptidase [Bacteroidota bacterium]
MLRNSVYTFASMLLFFAGVISYGTILNLREVSLQEAMQMKGISKLENISIIVDRKNHALELYSDEILVKTYRAVFGKSRAPLKTSIDDHVTPTGKYQVCSKDDNSVYHKYLQLNYPNERDAAEALKNGYINRSDFNKIMKSIVTDGKPCADSKLGSGIGIHGIGEYDIIFKNLPFNFNWTNGSIAVSNSSIDELHTVVQIGTNVEIKN